MPLCANDKRRRKTLKRKKMSSRTVAKDVDAYLAALPDEARATLEKIRKVIKAAAPAAVEVISYQIPTYKYHGMLVSFAAFPNHCGFYVGTYILEMEAFKDELKSYDIGKGTIRFPVNKPLPATLVRKIVKARMAQNEVKAAANKRKRAAL